jgi:tRNA pseudouridine38-40 synthase
MRIALGLEYDGSGFCGWQSQAGGGAVQDALEAALAVVADAPVRVVCAGRTDAGVHALEQVVHFDTEAVRPDTAWVRGVNAHLPASVAVRWAQQAVPDEFHARFSARGRRYRYLLLNRASVPGLHGRARRLVSPAARRRAWRGGGPAARRT